MCTENKVNREDPEMDPWGNYILSGGYVRAEDADYWDGFEHILVVTEHTSRWFNVHRLNYSESRPLGYGIRWEITCQREIAELEESKLFMEQWVGCAWVLGVVWEVEIRCGRQHDV